GRAAADDQLRVGGAVQLAPQPLVFQVQLAVGEQPADLAQHFVEQDRLHQVIVRAALKGLHGVFDGAVGGDEQDKGFGTDLEQPLQQLDAVDVRELHVAQ